MGWGSSQRQLRRRHILDDEEHLTRLDQAELTPGEFLDGGRFLPQPPGFFPQLRILGPRPSHIGRKRTVLAPRLHQGQHAAIANQSSEAEDEGEEQQQEPQSASPPPGTPAPVCRLARRAP